LDILLVDDEEDVRKSLSSFLTRLGHHVDCAADGEEGFSEFHEKRYDLVISDIRMPRMDGLEFLRRIKEVARFSVEFILVTGHGDMESAVRAIKYGAYDYLEKPVDIHELSHKIDRLAEYIDLREKYANLKHEFDEKVDIKAGAYRMEANRLREAYLREIGIGDLQVYSDAMLHVVRLAEKFAIDRHIPVLIEGESGTGKELVARFIHHYGDSETSQPFVAVNCGAIPEGLAESELFGHEKGAYTGATSKGRMGKLEMANGGTVLFDEIGEMPHSLQIKLLRVLESKRIYRVGGNSEIKLDFRVLSSTNKSLLKEVEAKRFRLDLFYRINAGFISIPPLRERREDIPPLAHLFARKASARRGKRFGRFTQSGEDFLVRFQWPGNVRQLKNAMERLAFFGPWDHVEKSDLAFIEDSFPEKKKIDYPREDGFVLGSSGFELPEEMLNLEALNRQIVEKALAKHQYNKTRTAQYLWITRRALQGRLKKWELI
jgi:two-component system, NtrC family, response regulator AtoC